MKLRPENYSFSHFMLTHTSQMEFPILIFWTSSQPDPTPPWLCGFWSGSALFVNAPQNGGKA